MKCVFFLGIFCLLAIAVSAGKNQKNDYPQENYEVLKEHDVKKYKADHKHHHHHQDYKYNDKHYHNSEKHSYKNKASDKETLKKQKHVPKSAPFEVPEHEAAYQADVTKNKKHLKEQQVKPEEDLHLQDLALEENLKSKAKNNKSPHQYQRGHHKSSQHFNHHNAKEQVQIEEKLFEEQPLNDKAEKPAPPVLEDTFEALNDNVESKKHHSKKASKHAKANQKGKKEKKHKKEKKQKKEKAEKKW